VSTILSLSLEALSHRRAKEGQPGLTCLPAASRRKQFHIPEAVPAHTLTWRRAVEIKNLKHKVPKEIINSNSKKPARAVFCTAQNNLS
jgi:hypothetical protein